MPIDGINIIQGEGWAICCVEDFSGRLKEIIREELNAICYGKSRVDQDDLGHYSYKRTLRDFMKRYSDKDDTKKKGMMGEFISHLIIKRALPNLQTISILFNKEELSVKKGFDLNYIDLEEGAIWYGEVKSGELAPPDHQDGKNKDLINLAKRGILDFLSGERPNLWDSVIIDAGLSFAANDQKTVQDLLKTDIRQIEENPDTKKNAVLVSVLFHDIQNRVTSQSVVDHLANIIEEAHFSKVVLFCIQKSTYSRIEDFLNQEAAE